MFNNTINRRKFLELSGSSIAGFSLSSLFSWLPINQKKDLSNDKPNILLILTDQMFAGAMSCANNKDVKTPSVEGRKLRNWRSFVVSETAFNGNGESDKSMMINGNRIKGRMLRSRQYKYIVYSEGLLREQLFDLKKDPGEMKNLACISEYKTILRKHRMLLAKWCKENKDLFIVPYSG